MASVEASAGAGRGVAPAGAPRTIVSARMAIPVALAQGQDLRNKLSATISPSSGEAGGARLHVGAAWKKNELNRPQGRFAGPSGAKSGLRCGDPAGRVRPGRIS